MNGFGDDGPDDAYDPTTPADPEQVARRHHDLRVAREPLLHRWDDLSAGERAAAVAVMVALLEQLRREGTLR